MSQICKLEYQEENSRTYPVSINELKVINRVEDAFVNESGTYIDVLHFVRDIFSLLDFSGIIKGKNER
ncbi:MAG: hypothetical protein GX905_06410 [Bacteroidales bacterium]|nr:hypothetical protein [Bacteroidales bacterium]